MPEVNASHGKMQSFLRTVPLLRGLDDATVAILVHNCCLKRVRRGDVIYRRGDAAEVLYIVLSGSIAEFAGGPNELELIVKVRRSTDYFGEIGIITDAPQMVTAVAIEASALIIVPRREFMKLVQSEPSMMKYLFKTLAERLEKSGAREIAYAFLDAPGRLANYILWLEKEEGSTGLISVSQDYLAEGCGLARQTVARILGRWRQDNVIVTRRNRLEILDMCAIKRIVLKSIS